MVKVTRNGLICMQTPLMTLACCTYLVFGTRSQNAFVISTRQLRGRYNRCQSREFIAAFSTIASSQQGKVLLEESSLSKWKFLARNQDRSKPIRNILVCGDGDLSFSAGIAAELEILDIKLFATVLEDENTHNKVYKLSSFNANKIKMAGHESIFGVDATKLSSYFGAESGREPTLFDRIQFNFPHWRGKANNRYNRKLLDEFLESASKVLSHNGEIHVALCGGQGGVSATTLQEWKGSWTASLYGCKHGLLLAKTHSYEAQYNLSSHRGVDRPFKLGKDPMMHIFLKPDGMIAASKNIQLCCRHELHVIVPDDNGISDVCFLDQICAGDGVESIIQNIVPTGVRVEVPARKILDHHETHEGSRIAVFLVVYCSEKYPVTRCSADEWRAKAELEVGKVIPLRQNRAGRSVSHPFPYTALHPEIKYNTKLM